MRIKIIVGVNAAILVIVVGDGCQEFPLVLKSMLKLKV